jgi:spore coat polysaccharide biosynthesis protein SpsF
MADDDVCVRITADNVFPDGSFVGSLLEEFLAAGCDYLNTANTLPYGLAAEMFRVDCLRDAAAATRADHDIEHVTPWIKRHRQCQMSRNAFGFGAIRSLRCTIDTLEDYVAMSRLFRPFADPVAVDFRDLVGALVAAAASTEVSAAPRPGPALVVGTVQLGMAYGRGNRTGKPSLDAAIDIVKAAARHGITQFDTARAYGDSEHVLGLAARQVSEPGLQIITKLSPLPADISDLPPRVLSGLVEGSVYRSLFELRVGRLPTLLLHRATQVGDRDGFVWNELKRLREQGLIGRLGASVQSPAELEAVLAVPEVEHVQLPFNLLDRRWDELLRTRSRGGAVTIHVRSAFLQGLLAGADEAAWPKIAGVDPRAILGTLDGLVERFGRESRTDLCLAFVRAAPWVDGVVVGMETEDQLLENIRLFGKPTLEPGQFDHVRAAFRAIPEALLDPSKWN